MTTVDQLTPQQHREGKRLRRRVIVEQNRLARLAAMVADQEGDGDVPVSLIVTYGELAEQTAKVRAARKALVDFGLALGLVQ